MALVNLTLSGVKMEGASKFSFVEAGIYESKIVETEVKETASKTGTYISVVHEIIVGQHAGKKINDILNIINDNEDAVRIGKARLVRYLSLVGKNTDFLADTDELIGAAYKVEVSEDITEKGKNSKIKKILSISDQQQAIQPVEQKAAPAATESRPLPWAKK